MAKARRVYAELLKAGFALVRQRGSHRLLQHPDGREGFTYHDREDLGGPAMAIVAKEFGLSVDELRPLV